MNNMPNQFSDFHLCFNKDLNREQRKPVAPLLMLSNRGLPNYNLWEVIDFEWIWNQFQINNPWRLTPYIKI